MIICFQSILSDINIISRDKTDWGEEEKLELESQLLLARVPTLCIKPERSLCFSLTKLNHNLHIWNTHRLQRTARKFSQVTVNKKRKWDQDQHTHSHGLELFSFVSKNKLKTAHTSGSTRVLKLDEKNKSIPVPNLDSPLLGPPSDGVHITSFKAFEQPTIVDSCTPQLIEEYVLETDIPLQKENSKRVYRIRLSILRRPMNFEYLGELYLEWDHKQNEQNNGVACQFSLGTKAHANKYIHQFTDIFTDNFRKRVKIRHRSSSLYSYKEKVAVQTQPAQVNYFVF